MLRLTITQRLTGTYAVLTAAVIVPAIYGLHVLVAKNLESSGVAAARTEAVHLAHDVRRQLDEDILVDFRGEPANYHAMKADGADWAVVRGSGKVEHAAGAFREGLAPHPDETECRIAKTSGPWFRVASARLVDDTGPALADLPDAARKAALSRCPQGTFLNAKLEISGDRNVVAFKFLEPGTIVEVQVTEDGRFIRRRVEALPGTLSAKLLESFGNLAEVTGLEWTSHDGQLIALIDGRRPDGAAARMCLNRLGEEFRIGADGNVIGMVPESRLHVVTAHDISGEIRMKASALRSLFLSGALVWAAIVGMGWYVTRRALSPVGEIVERLRRIAPAQISERLPVGKADDELSRIAATINSMLDRLEGAYRRESQFTGDASHELRAPITKVLADIDVALSQERTSGEYRETLLRVRGYAEHMKRLVESLLLLARLEGASLERSVFDLGELGVETVRSFSEEEARRIELELERSDAPIEVCAERRLIGVLLHNFIENALRYSPPSKPVVVRLGGNGASAVGEIEDAGPGVDPAEASRLFDRFRRADAARSRESGGFGLGLSIVKSIADAHGIQVELRPGGAGNIARFTIPRTIRPA